MCGQAKTGKTAFSVRRLDASDVDLLMELTALFAAEFEDAASYASSPPRKDYLADLLRDAGFIALVATSENRIIGGLVAYTLRKFEQDRSEVYVYDLAVAFHRRREGVATHLIQTLKPVARELGAWVIFVQADYGDTPAIALYESVGVREEVLHFDIPVS
ncbi:AAC(3)-I family aminoglycoside N-acetyltransferase [Amorphus coralli]|uniref:AAC(3)-I family aminoglycoside N-acetyltransferase n=1 Tax=Amorphus coralli TaxID=340680 RepID=UPI00035C5487|nr:AAC(3)-I family aminoglycoside N-acetyltransferase [Amorphus coralli]